jgi:hypothetical protein
MTGWHHTEISLYTPSSRRAALPLLLHPPRKDHSRPSHHAPIGEEGRKNDRSGFFGYYSVWVLIWCFALLFPRALYIFLDRGFLDTKDNYYCWSLIMLSLKDDPEAFPVRQLTILGE